MRSVALVDELKRLTSSFAVFTIPLEMMSEENWDAKEEPRRLMDATTIRASIVFRIDAGLFDYQCASTQKDSLLQFKDASCFIALHYCSFPALAGN
jgi:hypothetical protein